jgi:hypothetical protein
MIEYNNYEIHEVRNTPFKYVLSTTPIDSFEFMLTKEQLIENIKSEGVPPYDINGFDDITSLEDYISNVVMNDIEEKPHTFRYTCIPNSGINNCELVAITKISKTGTCFIFSNNEKYLKLIQNSDNRV